jgi:hypothetical protein
VKFASPQHNELQIIGFVLLNHPCTLDVVIIFFQYTAGFHCLIFFFFFWPGLLNSNCDPPDFCLLSHRIIGLSHWHPAPLANILFRVFVPICTNEICLVFFYLIICVCGFALCGYLRLLNSEMGIFIEQYLIKLRFSIV